MLFYFQCKEYTSPPMMLHCLHIRFQVNAFTPVRVVVECRLGEGNIRKNTHYSSGALSFRMMDFFRTGFASRRVDRNK